MKKKVSEMYLKDPKRLSPIAKQTKFVDSSPIDEILAKKKYENVKLTLKSDNVIFC